MWRGKNNWKTVKPNCVLRWHLQYIILLNFPRVVLLKRYKFELVVYKLSFFLFGYKFLCLSFDSWRTATWLNAFAYLSSSSFALYTKWILTRYLTNFEVVSMKLSCYSTYNTLSSRQYIYFTVATIFENTSNIFVLFGGTDLLPLFPNQFTVDVNI